MEPSGSGLICIQSHLQSHSLHHGITTNPAQMETHPRRRQSRPVELAVYNFENVVYIMSVRLGSYVKIYHILGDRDII